MPASPSQTSSLQLKRQPLVFNLRELRKFSGSRPLTQRELSRQAGLSVQVVRRIERASQLPTPVANLVKLSVALGVKLDDVVRSPLSRSPIGHLEIGNTAPLKFLAVVRRQRVTAAVVVGVDKVYDLGRTLTAGLSCGERIRRLVLRLGAEHGINAVLVEPHSPVSRALEPTSLHLHERSLKIAAARLVSQLPGNQRKLTRAVLERLPVLSQYVGTATLQAQRWMPDRRRMSIILAAALALAEHTRG